MEKQGESNEWKRLIADAWRNVNDNLIKLKACQRFDIRTIEYDLSNSNQDYFALREACVKLNQYAVYSRFFNETPEAER